MKKFVLASNNSGKIVEIKELLSEIPIHLISQQEFNIPEIEETGETFIENAILKARHASKFSKLPAIADDSGLVVDALHGAPGVRSARYAGPGATNGDRIQKLLKELKSIPSSTSSTSSKRTAHFHCVIALLRYEHDPAPIICHGVWSGEILKEPRGEKGFGYDPVFYLATYGQTAAELEPHIKNSISHRGQAIQQLIKALDKELLKDLEKNLH